MQKIINAITGFLVACLALVSCVNTDTWDFDYPQSTLCGGTWSGQAAKIDGKWLDITGSAYKDLQFTISFSTDGTYYGTGYFGNGSGMYEAHGNTIKTYVGGELFYTYIVHSMSGDTAEITMKGSGQSTIDFRVKKR